MQLNKVYSVKEMDCVAVELGETVHRTLDLPIGMKSEDGIIWVYCTGDDSVISFTPFGIENLQELIEMNRDPERSPRCGLRWMLTTDCGFSSFTSNRDSLEILSRCACS